MLYVQYVFPVVHVALLLFRHLLVLLLILGLKFGLVCVDTCSFRLLGVTSMVVLLQLWWLPIIS